MATVEITRIDIYRFAEVPWEFVAAEGEGDESVQASREGHRSEWAALGLAVNDDAAVVCLRFVLV